MGRKSKTLKPDTKPIEFKPDTTEKKGQWLKNNKWGKTFLVESKQEIDLQLKKSFIEKV